MLAEERSSTSARTSRHQRQERWAVERELGLAETSVRAWVKRADIDERKDPQGPLTSEERAENSRLRRELKTVTMERDFLRKAAAFFARSGK
jgi:transposase